MPQASDDLRDIMDHLFMNGGISDKEPTEFLESRGYVLLGNWTWRLPHPDHCMTEKEELCIRFLRDEWDYGGFEEVPDPDPPKSIRDELDPDKTQPRCPCGQDWDRCCKPNC